MYSMNIPVHVVGVDGSPASDAAMEHVFATSQPLDQIFVITAYRSPPIPADNRNFLPDSYERKKLRAGQVQEHYKEMCKKAGKKCTFIMARHSEPGASGTASKLCEEALDLKATDLTLGARGMGALQRTMLGSISDYIVHNCPCPVTIVKEKDWVPSG